MRVLITGATGFLGSHLCRRMAADGHQVRILCRPTSDLSIFEGIRVEREIGDVTDAERVRAAVQGSDWVIHAAAHLGHREQDREQQHRVNVEGTRLVAQACRAEGVRRLVHVSSAAAVGIPLDARHPADEEFPFNLEQTGLVYHISKRRGEEAVMAEVARGLDAVIVNPAFVFGPYRAWYRGADMLRKVRLSRIVLYFAGGICAAHVEDVVEGMVSAVERGVTGQRYILGGENLTFRSLAERAARAMNVRRQFVPAPPLVTGLAAAILEPWGRLRGRPPRITYAVHDYARRYHFYSSDRARCVLGYTPRHFAAILEEAVRLGAC